MDLGEKVLETRRWCQLFHWYVVLSPVSFAVYCPPALLAERVDWLLVVRMLVQRSAVQWQLFFP